MSETLLEEFLDGATGVQRSDGTTVPMVLFSRALSQDEIRAVEDLMTVGDGLE